MPASLALPLVWRTLQLLETWQPAVQVVLLLDAAHQHSFVMIELFPSAARPKGLLNKPVLLLVVWGGLGTVECVGTSDNLEAVVPSMPSCAR
jgi:hypothetical protein